MLYSPSETKDKKNLPSKSQEVPEDNSFTNIFAYGIGSPFSSVTVPDRLCPSNELDPKNIRVIVNRRK